MLSQKQINDIYALLKDVGNYQEAEHRTFAINEINEKSLNQLVSFVDITSEQMLVKGLKEITPEAGFITEESTVENSSSDFQWIIDPLDGTTNFLFQHQQFAISIALQYKDETIFGCIYIPFMNEIYMANPDGAFLNFHSFKMMERAPLSNCLIATGFPYYDFKELDQYLQILKHLMKHTRGLRRMGSAAIDLAYTAEGKFNGFFELNLSPWDVAAGAYIVKQAGGMVIDFNGGDNYVFGRSIIAGNTSVVPELYEIIKRCMQKENE